MAKLYFRYGAMGSSKTANALIADYNYHERDKQAPLVRPRADSRSEDRTIHSRMGLEKGGIPLEELVEMVDEEAWKYDYIIVDEAQFATKVQVEFFVHIMDDLDVSVIYYGLRMDFHREFSEGSLWLMAWTNKIEETRTACWCRKVATCSTRISGDRRTIQPGEQIVVGGNDKYTMPCRKHHREGDLGK